MDKMKVEKSDFPRTAIVGNGSTNTEYLGPCYHITVWPDATDGEMQEIASLFETAFPLEVMGNFVVTREGIELHRIDDHDSEGIVRRMLDKRTFAKLKEQNENEDL